MTREQIEAALDKAEVIESLWTTADVIPDLSDLSDVLDNAIAALRALLRALPVLEASREQARVKDEQAGFIALTPAATARDIADRDRANAATEDAIREYDRQEEAQHD